MSEQRIKTEKAVEEVLEKLSDGLVALFEFATIVKELPPEDHTLVMDMLVKKAEEKGHFDSISAALDEGGQALRELLMELKDEAEKRKQEEE